MNVSVTELEKFFRLLVAAKKAMMHMNAPSGEQYACRVPWGECCELREAVLDLERS